MNTRHKTGWALAAAAVIAGIVASKGMGTLDPRESGEAAAPAPAAVSAIKNLAPVGGEITAQGTTLEYSAEFDSRIGPPDEAKAHVFAGSLKLTLRQQRSDPGPLLFAGSIADIAVTYVGASDNGDEAQRSLTEDLGKPFLLLVEPNGKFAQVGLKPSEVAVGQNMIRQILSALQFQAAPSADAKQWAHDELDHLGALKASYRQLSAWEYEKTKAYTPTSPGFDFAPPQIESVAKFGFGDGQSWPRRVQAKETVRMSTFLATTDLVLQLSSARSERLGHADLSGFTLSKLDRASKPRANPEQIADRQKALAGGATFGQLLDQLQAPEMAKAAVTDLHHLHLRMGALFDTEPRAIADAERALRNGKTGKNTARILGALADSTSAEATRTLAKLGRDTALPSDLREAAVSNLSLQMTPDAATFGELGELATSDDPSVRGAAVLGLGTSARFGGEADATSSLAQSATKELGTSFRNAQTPDEKLLFLQALGNAGSGEALDAAKASLADPDPEVRAAAVGSLRFAPGAEADALIANAWLTDPEPFVRTQATFAAAYRAVSPLLAETATKVLKTDSSVEVRGGIARYMGDNLRASPLFAAALADAAKTDADQDVRVAAARAGAPPRPTQPPTHTDGGS